ncbi:ASCH domain-containing protein [Halomonas cupida]|uniref:ASCH domain-containing protein n=1 Tax=Halomonas cupida TaxID=44933 RepID=UPI003EFAF1E8
MDQYQEAFLERYLATLPVTSSTAGRAFSAGYYCDNQQEANLCASLILAGKKRATSSLYEGYVRAGLSLPKKGDLHVVTDWQGCPVCVVEVTSVNRCRFIDVTEAFAEQEGEGDGSLAWWREAHWDFFTRECYSLGVQPSEEIALVLECFEVVYPRRESMNHDKG